MHRHAANDVSALVVDGNPFVSMADAAGANASERLKAALTVQVAPAGDPNNVSHLSAKLGTFIFSAFAMGGGGGGSGRTAVREIALGKDIAGGGLKELAKQTGASWWRNWARDGITRRTVTNHFGRAFHDAVKRSTRIHFSLDGIAANEIADAVRRGAAGFRPGNMTNAELHYISQTASALAKTTFYRAGRVVPSPF